MHFNEVLSPFVIAGFYCSVGHGINLTRLQRYEVPFYWYNDLAISPMDHFPRKVRQILIFTSWGIGG